METSTNGITHDPITPETTTTNNTHPDKNHSLFARCFSFITLIIFPILHFFKASQLIPVLIITAPPPTTRVIYLNARIGEWRVIFAIACLLVGSSLTMYQVQQAFSNPLTYAFISLTQCRAFAALTYAAVLLIYFDNENIHTADFSVVWGKAVTESENNIWNIWVMFSLPIVSTVWALLSYLLAILTLIFRPTTPQTMPFSLNVTLQVVVVVLTVLDLVCLMCIWVTLNRFNLGR